MNALKNESSPYLLQHANNPVNWYPWNDDLLKYAKEHNKLLIISIGYAACHWCHVMEKESFEDKEVAGIMNKHFVCIKVDREERPDVDQVYMEAAQLITGSGGWPLNAFTMPDGRPFYAGTYFPKEQWISVLQQIIELEKNQISKLNQHAGAITKGLQQSDDEIIKTPQKEFKSEDLHSGLEKWSRSFDYEWGGTAGAPKFPMPSGWEFLVHYENEHKDDNIRNYLEKSLLRIANGGIYDHVGGGFARYSVDEKWHVPHFEKMLYDNAQLVSLYSHAFQKTAKDVFKQRIIQTLDFAGQELESPEGGFYSSLDADSEGVEGKYYVWTKNEIENLLGDKTALFCEYYSVTDYGNWENDINVMWIQKEKQALCKKYDVSSDEFDFIIAEALSKLKEYRDKREKPALDDKILTSWNALMISALVDAYNATKIDLYLDKAIKTTEFITDRLLKEDLSLYRNCKNNTPSINAFLDDYANFISALIKLYQACFNENYLNLAYRLNDYVIKNFSDTDQVFFNYKSKLDKQLIAAKKEMDDNVIPSSNSTMAKNLFVLGRYFDNKEFIDRSALMLSNIKKRMSGNIGFYSNWADLYLSFSKPFKEIVISGPDIQKLQNELSCHYLPGVIMAGADKHSQLSLLKDRIQNKEDRIYVCVNKTCNMPVSDVVEVISLLDSKKT